MIQPGYKREIIIKCDLNKDQTQLINNYIVSDFDSFKHKNELSYCTLKQEKLGRFNYNTTFSTTVKYINYSSLPQDKVKKDFENFCVINSGDYCAIAKLTCQDTTYIAEFNVERIYSLTL